MRAHFQKASQSCFSPSLPPAVAAGRAGIGSDPVSGPVANTGWLDGRVRAPLLSSNAEYTAHRNIQLYQSDCVLLLLLL